MKDEVYLFSMYSTLVCMIFFVTVYAFFRQNLYWINKKF